MSMINERVLINLGIISLLNSPPHRVHKEIVSGTFFQDIRLSLESKLLALIVRNFDKLRLWRYLDKMDVRYDTAADLNRVHFTTGEWRTELEAALIQASTFERHIRPLYRHCENNLYVVNPGTEEEMFLYYNLSPQMCIEASRELLNVYVWFLGMHEIFSSESLGDWITEVRGRYTKNV